MTAVSETEKSAGQESTDQPYSPAVAANPPADNPGAAIVAIITAIALLAAAVIAGREFLIERDVISGRPWIRNTFEWISRISWQPWMWAAAIAALVVGALLLLAVFKPRRKSHFPGKDQPVLWLRPTDAARLSTAAALRVPGVLHAQTTVSKRKATVRVTTDADDPGRVSEPVTTLVTNELKGLDKTPKVKVNTVHAPKPKPLPATPSTATAEEKS